MKLTFEEVHNFNNRFFIVFNKKQERLGSIEFYKDWRCWIWYQEKDVMMSSECLQQVVDKLKELDG